MRRGERVIPYTQAQALRAVLLKGTQVGQDTPMSDDCSSSFAAHDLAALSEGNLSEQGLHRLAAHVSECRACMVALASLVDDARDAEAADEQPRGLRLVPDSGAGATHPSDPPRSEARATPRHTGH